MKKLVGLALILAGLALGFFGLPSIIGNNSPTAILSQLQSGDNKAVTDKITNIASNSVLEYDYTNAVKLDSNETVTIVKKFNIPFTSKNIVLIYNGKMKIGADVSQIKVNVDKDMSGGINNVTITLPEMEIISHEFDRDSISSPIEKSSLFSSIKTKDYDELEKVAREKIESSVKSSAVMTQAEQILKDNMTGFLHGLYGESVEVIFK